MISKEYLNDKYRNIFLLFQNNFAVALKLLAASVKLQWNSCLQMVIGIFIVKESYKYDFDFIRLEWQNEKGDPNRVQTLDKYVRYKNTNLTELI